MIPVSLPERPDWILHDERIGGDQHKALAERLRHQQSVKRIAMQQRQLARKDGILLGQVNLSRLATASASTITGGQISRLSHCQPLRGAVWKTRCQVGK